MSWCDQSVREMMRTLRIEIDYDAYILLLKKLGKEQLMRRVSCQTELITVEHSRSFWRRQKLNKVATQPLQHLYKIEA